MENKDKFLKKVAQDENDATENKMFNDIQTDAIKLTLDGGRKLQLNPNIRLAVINGEYFIHKVESGSFLKLSEELYNAIIFTRFVIVRTIGNYNMFTEASSAAKDAQLDIMQYRWVMDNFEKLNQTYPSIIPVIEQKYMEELRNEQK